MRVTETQVDEGVDPSRRGRGLSITLWTVQGILAILFVFSGVMKFVMSVSQMTKQMPFSGNFLHMIGAFEILGGIGLILPALLRILPVLTPVAACGLIIIMIGAVFTIGMHWVAAFPLLLGVLAVFIAYGRFRLRPIPSRV